MYSINIQQVKVKKYLSLPIYQQIANEIGKCIVFVVNSRYTVYILYTKKVFQLTRFSHNTVFFRNQNARYAGTRCTYLRNPVYSEQDKRDNQRI